MTIDTTGRGKGTLILALIGMTVLASCGVRDRLFPAGTGQASVALPYRAKLSRDAADRRNFAVTVRAPGATLETARESARFPATRYCLETFGGSDVAWTRDPASGDWAVVYGDGTLTVSGRCLFRG